jgi:hypothetical protein
LVGGNERAEPELRSAIDASGDSPAHPIDELRASLATVLRRLDRRDEAIELLRKRRVRGDASPELLRALANQLGPAPGDFQAPRLDDDAPERLEAVSALREAATHHSDPRRGMTLHNLYALLHGGSDQEDAQADELVDELMATDAYYRRAWYVHRAKAASHWHRGGRLVEAGDADEAPGHFEAAARWYSSALRARPKLRIGMQRYRWVRFPPSAVLLANARDAHWAAGHQLRARWYGWRMNLGTTV